MRTKNEDKNRQKMMKLTKIDKNDKNWEKVQVNQQQLLGPRRDILAVKKLIAKKLLTIFDLQRTHAWFI